MFTYLQPKTVTEAVDMLHTHEDIRIMAGGTDMLVAVRDGEPCRYLMDIKHIAGMDAIEATGSGLSIGGAVVLNKLMSSEHVTGCYSVLNDAGLRFAHHNLRNRATLVGNLCSALPGGDMIGASLVLGGYIEAASKEGTRSIPLSEFFVGLMTNALRKDELALRVVFPRRDGKGIYLKKQRVRGHDLAQVGVTMFRGSDGSFDLALGAVAKTTVLLKDVVKAGEEPRPDKIIETALANINPRSGVRCSREYRIEIVQHFIRQAVAILDGKEAAV
ncbi:MAG: FAD binding domain-containing protein [Defluviitaleaceae bacterium]|nr:FAD binding domain-containing protein [Defluviitaleaceae bacterium]